MTTVPVVPATDVRRRSVAPRRGRRADRHRLPSRRRRPGPRHQGPCQRRHVARRDRARRGPRRLRRSARCSARSASTGARPGRKERPVARIVLAGVDRRRRRRRARPGPRARRRRLALTHPGHRAGQPQDPGLAGRAGRRDRRATAGLEVTVWDEQRLAEPRASAASSPSAAARSTPPRLIRMDYTPRGATKSHAHGRAGRQGHHLRHRRPRHQAERGHADDEARHERRRRGASPPWPRSRDVDCPVRVVGLVPAAENAVSGSAMRPGDVDPPLRRSHLRGQQHRRRGPPRAGRRDGVRRRRARARPSSSTSPPSPVR